MIHVQKTKIKVESLEGVRKQSKKAAKTENRHLRAAWLWQQKSAITEKQEKDQNYKERYRAWEKTTSRCITW